MANAGISMDFQTGSAPQQMVDREIKIELHPRVVMIKELFMEMLSSATTSSNDSRYLRKLQFKLVLSNLSGQE